MTNPQLLWTRKWRKGLQPGDRLGPRQEETLIFLIVLSVVEKAIVQKVV